MLTNCEYTEHWRSNQSWAYLVSLSMMVLLVWELSCSVNCCYCLKVMAVADNRQLIGGLQRDVGVVPFSCVHTRCFTPSIYRLRGLGCVCGAELQPLQPVSSWGYCRLHGQGFCACVQARPRDRDRDRDWRSSQSWWDGSSVLCKQFFYTLTVIVKVSFIGIVLVSMVEIVLSSECKTLNTCDVCCSVGSVETF